MRKIIRKRVRRQGQGLNVAADVDAVIAVNTGSSKSQAVQAESRHRVVQDSARPDAEPDNQEAEEKEGQ